VAKWAAFFGVSTSGYYAWVQGKDHRKEREHRYAAAVREAFNSGEGVYGVDRVCGVMRRSGAKASYPKVARHMQAMGLHSIHNRRRQRSLTDGRTVRDAAYPNLVRGLEIREPFQVITSDITYIKTGEGFEYLCKVKDVVSGVVLGESMMDNMKAELVVQAIKNTMKRWHIPAGAIFHSDRGSQYTSAAVTELLQKHGFRQSYSRVGKPGDNAWSESFFANFKKEDIHWQWFPTRVRARQAVFAYIESFYNTRRVQKRLGYLSPKEWLKYWLDGRLRLTA
jgi:putative transposase